ncbi:high mobility group box domain-containing protein [Sporodiniella umbellata]|nr:high mobility group box domain-containing protein [Sporodiniella umbellata]
MIIPNEEDPAAQKPLTLSLYQDKIPVTKPEKVKRPPNAYLLFNRDMRSRLKGINKGLTSGEISKNISQRWKQLSKIEKDEYFKQEALLKHTLPNVIYFRRSNAELKKAGKLKKAQTASSSSSSSSSSSIEKKTFYKKKSNTDDCGGIPDPRGRKKKSNTSLPKHPMSAYLHFAKRMRPIIKESFPEATLVDISRQIGSKWRSLSPSELCPWIDLANQDKARYAKETKEIISHEGMTS